MVSNIALALRRVVIATSALMLCAAAPAAELLADQPRSMLPRYRLKLGQELVYRVTASEDLRDSKGEKNASGHAPRERSQWHITVVRENDDGSWRLFIRSEQASLNPDGSERRKFDSFDYCDLHADGSYSLNEQTAIFNMLVPYELFCRLPDTPAELRLCYQGIRSRNLEDFRKARTEARAVLVAGRKQAEVEYFKDLYAINLQAHDKEEKWHLADVQNRQRFFAGAQSFSTTWQASALDGGRFRLADHRGKVVVLYFWSEGCEYCMLAAPQISKLAADYKDQDVSVVGMLVRFGETADDDSAVPRRASSKAYRGFSHVEAKEVYNLYHLQQYGFGTPSTLVLDQEGKVREALSGYAADLGQCVRKAVDELRGDARDAR